MNSDSAWCVNCGAQTPQLFQRYSDSVLKLVKCSKCGNIADKYVEYEPVVVLIDLVLLSKEACRHILLNGDFKCHWKLAILISLIDAYRSHTAGRTSAHSSPATMKLTETFDIWDSGNVFYLTYFHSLLSCIVYVFVVLFLSLVMVRSRPPMVLVWKSVVLAGCSIFLMIPALICGNPHHYWALVVAYWLIAQVFVHHVVSGTSKAVSAFVILVAVLARSCVSLSLWSLPPTCDDSFVNSQEWTLSRSVPDLRLGVVGSLASGKSALVHRYLTGSYMQEESPEGGRFKKEVIVEGSSYLLLIRDEGGPPENQFSAWVDAVIFVFSLENEASFNNVYNYYTKMVHYRNSSDVPLILVGMQDAISESSPRVIDDSRARKLAVDLKSSYIETCATYGLNVELVFQDACQKIVNQRIKQSSVSLTPNNSRPSTPQSPHHQPSTITARIYPQNVNTSGSSPGSLHGMHTPSHKEVLSMSSSSASPSPSFVPGGRQMHIISSPGLRHFEPTTSLQLETMENKMTLLSANKTSASQAMQSMSSHPHPQSHVPQPFECLVAPVSQKDLPTPSSTPTTSRKSRRRSNLFTQSKKGEDKLRNGELGSGRAIPLKQGYLYKRSSKTLNKEWKKKYVTLCDDGCLTYHSSLHDYMDDAHGKKISLQYVTVKVPGQKPRGSKTILSSGSSATLANNGIIDGLSSLSVSSFQNKDGRTDGKLRFTAFDHRDGSGKPSGVISNDDGSVCDNGISLNGPDTKTIDTPTVKKRHRRMKSSGFKTAECDDPDGYEFIIVSLDNKQWHFEASSSEERDEWIVAIEQQILNSLQGNEISKSRSRLHGAPDTTSIQQIRNCVPGNAYCADCDAPNPDWASLNLGILICIECSGIHRNLGSHISKVRSLVLDEWPPGNLGVLLALGNSIANSVWEATVSSRARPTPSSSREEKERWIRAKYESKEFLAPASRDAPLGQQLVDAVCRADIKSVYSLLAHCTPDDVNSTVSSTDLRTPLHLACALGNVAIAQLLIWHNANVKAVDHDDQTCLSLARASSRPSPSRPAVRASIVACLIELLQSNGCTEHPNSSPVFNVLPRSIDTLPSSVI